MRGPEDDERAMAEAASIEAFLDARLPPGEAGFVGWTRAAAAAAVIAERRALAPGNELSTLLARWAASPSVELQRSLGALVARSAAGAESPESPRGRSPVDLAAAAIAGLGGGWRMEAELALAAAARACRDLDERRALGAGVLETLRAPSPTERLVPPTPRSSASVPPGTSRLPPGWRLGGGFDDELGRERSGASAPRDWVADPSWLERVARSLESALGAQVLELLVERTRTRAYSATLRLELAGPDHARVRLERDPRGASEASIVVFGDGAEALFPDLCAALDEALGRAGRGPLRGAPAEHGGAGLGVHLRDASQSVTSLLRGRPILPSGFRWVEHDAVVSVALWGSFAQLERLLEALEQSLEAPGSISLSVRGRAPHERVQLAVSGGLDATIDAHASEVRIRAPTHAAVATVARALVAARSSLAREDA